MGNLGEDVQSTMPWRRRLRKGQEPFRTGLVSQDYEDPVNAEGFARDFIKRQYARRVGCPSLLGHLKAR